MKPTGLLKEDTIPHDGIFNPALDPSKHQDISAAMVEGVFFAGMDCEACSRSSRGGPSGYEILIPLIFSYTKLPYKCKFNIGILPRMTALIRQE